MATGKKGPAAAKPAANKGATSVGASDELLEAAGAEAAFERFLAEAATVEKITPFRAPAHVVYGNVAAGVEAILEKSQQVKAELPSVNLDDIAALKDLALGVGFAARKVDRTKGPQQDLPGLLDEAADLRGILLSAAIASSSAGLIPKKRSIGFVKARG